MSSAAILRSTVSAILGRDAGDAVLAPGGLVALRLLFHHQDVSTVLLSDREYYGPGHFSGTDVRVAPFEDLLPAARRHSPDAVVASLVSWRGEVGEVSALCRSFREEYGEDGPLVCVDWCHAGAGGFPSAAGLDADVIFGDASKWLVPAAVPDRLAFLAPRAGLSDTVRSCFRGFHASGGDEAAREARWVDCATLDEVARAVRGAADDPALLKARHSENMRLARSVAEANDRPPPDAAIVWFPGARPSDLRLGALPSSDLAWDTGSGTRVLCQAAP